MKETLRLLDLIYAMNGYKKVAYPQLVKYLNIKAIKYDLFIERRSWIYFYILLDSPEEKLFCSTSCWDHQITTEKSCIKFIDNNAIYMFINSKMNNSAYICKDNQLDKIDYELIKNYDYHPLVKKLHYE